MPIIYVKSIKDLNIKLIESNYLQFKDKKFNYEKLFLDYWRNELNLDFKNNYFNFKNSTMTEFRKNIIEYYFQIKMGKL